MRIGVIGAGVVGVTTANALLERGFTVEVIEAEAVAGQGASFANGGQLAYGHATPLGTPTLFSELHDILLQRSRGIRIGLTPRWNFLLWTIAFLYQSLPSTSNRNAKTLASIAKRSSALMDGYNERLGNRYDHARTGKIVLSGHPAKAGDLTPGEPEEIEPVLRRWRIPYRSATHSSSDEVGDAFRFTVCVAEDLANKGVVFHYGRCAKDLQRSHDQWLVTTDDGVMHFDALVICTANGSKTLLRSAGVNVPIFPVAGFSYTFSAGEAANTTSITAADHRIVFSHIGDTLRIAGYANINVRRNKALRAHAEQMLHTAMMLAPDAAEYKTDATPWIGYRPSTPSSIPIVGPSKKPGLYLNIGHGMLGWTLCAATGECIAETIAAAPYSGARRRLNAS